MSSITSSDIWAVQDLRTLAIFVKVAERRSFVRAATDLGITQSGVSNAINRLEDQLGVRLLARTTRQVSLTEDGAAFFERCRQVLADLEEAELVLKQTRLKPIGRLRIEMPVSFGRLKVVPLLGLFQAQYPELKLALSFTDRYVDLIEEGIDVSVRFGELQDSSLIARRLTQTQFPSADGNRYAAVATFTSPLLALTDNSWMSAFAPLLGDKRTSAGSTEPIYGYTALGTATRPY